jgi:hypothetical protein
MARAEGNPVTTPTLTPRGYELDGVEEAARVSKAATDLGSAIHAATDAWDRDADLPADDTLRVYVDAYRTWRAQYVADVVSIERVVWSSTLRYAGTLDRVYRMRDNRVLLGDIKSSKTVDGLYRAQLSAYSLALAECAGIHVDGRAIVWLPSNQPGTCKLIEYDDDAGDVLTWRCLCRLYHWWAAHADDWKETR